MPYQVILTNEAESFLKKCDKTTRLRILDKLEHLKENPHLGKPLTANLAGFWSLRTGDYRTIYRIDEGKIKIIIIRIGHRKNVY